jgi:hypothetical protein
MMPGIFKPEGIFTQTLKNFEYRPEKEQMAVKGR